MKKYKKIIILLSLILICFCLCCLAYFTHGQAYDNAKQNTQGSQSMEHDISSSPDLQIQISEPIQETDDFVDISADISSETEMTEYNTPSPDRITYYDGFYEEPLSDDIIKRINGVSYHENNDITFDDLRYLHVRYIDFDGVSQSGEIICNKAISNDLIEIFKALYDASYKIEKIKLIDEYQADDDLSCADNNTSSFNYRVVAGSNSLSKHALGLAIDINPFYNPYITYPDGKERISPPGSEPYADRTLDDDRLIKQGDLCYTLFKEHGFTWGGEWKSLKDYQHFQKSIE